MSTRNVSAMLCALGGILVGLAPADGHAVEEFYKGRTLTVVLPAAPGGAAPAYTLLLQPYLEKYIPGNPTIVINYMPGAGGLRAANYLYNVAPRDGSHIGSVLQEMVLTARLGVDAVRYDPLRFGYLAGADVARSTIVVMRTAGVTTLEEAKTKELVMAAGGKGSGTYMYPALANAILGTRFKIVLGYPGISQMDQAVEQGEVHGRAGSWGSIKGPRAHWVEQDLIVHLAISGPDREPDLPDVPLMTELATNDDDRKVLELVAETAVFGRPFVAPPEVPADRLAALREAFRKALAEPAVIAEAERRKLDLRPVSWETLEASARQIMQADQRAVQRLREILEIE